MVVFEIIFTCVSLTAGGVKLVFVNLDPDDPNRIFFAILDVVDDKIWNSKYMHRQFCKTEKF